MNIIGSNCCGANFYHHNNIPFSNPFIWAVTPYSDLIYLMTHWNNIDWFNIDLAPSNLRDNTFILTIDKNVNIHYVHYIFDVKKNKPKTMGASVYYQYIWEYLIDKYFIRVKRMLINNEPPSFIIHEEPFANTNAANAFNQIMHLDIPYKRVIVPRFTYIQPFKTKNVIVIDETRHKYQPQDMIEHHNKEIYDFLST